MPSLDTDDNTIDMGRAIEPARASELILPKPKDVLLVSYPETMDATAAAWVIYKVGRRDKIAMQFVKHDAHRIYTPPVEDVRDRNWIAICEAGFHASMVPTLRSPKSCITFMRSDEHQSLAPIPYRNWKRTPPYGVDDMTLGRRGSIHDPKNSLCLSVWNYFCSERGSSTPPRMLAHIDDYVMRRGRWNDSEAIAATVSSYEKSLPIYDQLAMACEDRRRREAMIASGQGIARYIASQKR